MAKKGSAEHRMLRIKVEGRQPRLEDLLRDRYTVGRGDPAQGIRVDFVIHGDESVSRLHGRIERQDDQGYAYVNESANGSLVNDQLVKDAKVLAHGDRVSIGEKTTLEYLLLSDAERSREFEALSAGSEEVRKKAEAVGARPLFQRPVVWAILGFYGLVALLLVVALGRKNREVPDPGPGPYFEWLQQTALNPVEGLGDRSRDIALRMWEEAKREYEPYLKEPTGHAYRLLLRARAVLEVLGYQNVNDAYANNEEAAEWLVDVSKDLDARVQGFYKEAQRTLEAGHKERALDNLRNIVLSVPDRSSPVREWALAGVERLRGR